MAKQVLLNSFLSINAVDLSSFATKIELAVEVDEKDVTTFGSGGWKELLGGIKSASINATFQQDIAAGQLDSQMFALLGTVTAFEVRLNAAARSTSNPGYTGNILLSKWSPISGGVGDDAEISVTWPVTAALARQTS